SPRRQQIEEHLAKENQRGAGAAQIAAHQTREGKMELSHEEMQDRHKAMAAQFGDQPERVVEAAQERKGQLQEEPGEKAIGQALAYSREKNLEREGVAGAGKTTSLAVVREAAEREGYKVEGFAPTSRAAQKLGEAGIESSTLQRHLTRSEEPHDGRKRLYVLDESSLASTKQMNEFLHGLKDG